MDNQTIESVKNAFGIQFQKFCSNHKIVLTKNECGAFMVSDAITLKQCLIFLKKDKKKLGIRLKKIQNSYPIDANHRNYPEELCGQFQSASKLNQNCCKKTTCSSVNVFLTNLSLEIYLHDTSSVLHYKSHRVTYKCILDTAKNGMEIYNDIINISVNNNINTCYKAFIPSISLLLEKFQKQHKKFHYFSILKNLMLKQEVDEKVNCKYAMNEKQMKLFIHLIFAKVIPLNIFGKLRNLKKIRKALFRLLKTPCFKPFDLKLYINKLDIFAIRWLQNIESPNVKWLLIAKFVKWLFTEFLVKILYTYFHVTTVSTGTNERLFILRSEWSKVNKQFVRRKLRSNVLQPDLSFNCWKPPIGRFKLKPKYATVRPIFALKKKEKNEHLYILHQFLKQLHITNFGLNTFEEKWRSIVQCKYTLKDKKMYLVSCDVSDAFGSIIQGKLFDIIRSLTENLPELMMLRTYSIKRKMLKYNMLRRMQYICDSHLQLPLPPGSLYARTNITRVIKKSWLLQNVWKYICYQSVKISNKQYIVAKGIVQGAMISSVLSDIYFDFIIQKEMTLFLTSGRIIKYVDDILFVTEDEECAKQFLQIIEQGIPKYNCRFKKEKLQTNVACDGNTITDHIIYIGYKINCDTLEVEPNVKSVNPLSLVGALSNKTLSPLKILQSRLFQLSILKLSKIVLDTRINSKITIMEILKKAGLIQAKRACVLIKALFDDVQNHTKKIFDIIRISNKRIARYIIRACLTYERNMKKSDIQTWNKEILSTLWTSYRLVFIKDAVLRKCLSKICGK